MTEEMDAAIAAQGDAAPLVIYSPAPAGNPMHALNLRFGEALAPRLGGPLAVEALALPQSINATLMLPAAERRRRWPIVTSVDFAPARAGAGPDWHGYPRPSPGLTYVARLYDVGFGIAGLAGGPATPDELRGRRIAVPARPSAVRLLSEVLLRDGWGMLGEVELVEMAPSAVVPALLAGEVAATSWNLVVPGEGGAAPILPSGAWRYLPITDEARMRINAANPFALAASPGPEGVPLLSFAQALAAWEDSDARAVVAALDLIAARPAIPGFPAGVEEMLNWPGLRSEAIHPAARQYYRGRGIML
ncbi:hypothetical protein ACFQ1E_18520 [Sphingomonas canadensis]|uniref:C4-dicarboxylate ABC transporter substrate-binding protein n=1 Tax=Sphingomonas canadensis TaxID=1219257 RepID=A0ABW3HGC9_9SPHN|nr:hypothetical protein [Sphingomonas canadensis]MCW3838122.1 hypothetical protein [Sphingomonas canadensis]